jgi:hypothetical protein
MNISKLTLDTLENEIQTNQIDVFIRHFKTVISQNDLGGSSVSVFNFLYKYQFKYPNFFVQFSKLLQQSIQKQDPILL